MAQACEDHVDDTGAQGLTGHTGTDGSSPFERMDRYGKWYRNASENIAYMSDTAIDIVMRLFIDDGVSSRGHRENIFASTSTVTGNFSGSHERYGFMTCITYAGGYDNNAAQESAEVDSTESSSTDGQQASSSTDTDSTVNNSTETVTSTSDSEDQNSTDTSSNDSSAATSTDTTEAEDISAQEEKVEAEDTSAQEETVEAEPVPEPEPVPAATPEPIPAPQPIVDELQEALNDYVLSFPLENKPGTCNFMFG